MPDFEKLFNPRAVGIIGANKKLFGGGFFLKSLVNFGFEKPLYLFNPRLKGEELDGYTVYGSILEVDDDDKLKIEVHGKLNPIEGIKLATVFINQALSKMSIDKPKIEKPTLNDAMIINGSKKNGWNLCN